jgi:hypothetical protein
MDKYFDLLKKEVEHSSMSTSFYYVKNNIYIKPTKINPPQRTNKTFAKVAILTSLLRNTCTDDIG